jgi:hypothetical protein
MAGGFALFFNALTLEHQSMMDLSHFFPDFTASSRGRAGRGSGGRQGEAAAERG